MISLLSESYTVIMQHEESVDELMATGKVTNVAILNSIGKPLATSPGYDVTTEEGTQIANGFDLVHGLRGFDFVLNGQHHRVDSVLTSEKLIAHRANGAPDAHDAHSHRRKSADRQAASHHRTKAPAPRARAMMAHAGDVILVVEFDGDINADVQALVDDFVKSQQHPS